MSQTDSIDSHLLNMTYSEKYQNNAAHNTTPAKIPIPAKNRYLGIQDPGHIVTATRSSSGSKSSGKGLVVML